RLRIDIERHPVLAHHVVDGDVHLADIVQLLGDDQLRDGRRVVEGQRPGGQAVGEPHSAIARLTQVDVTFMPTFS
ncbi:MAG TPA: hypothetical protein PL137_25505, partial [Nocardioides sp.]|nr:hypothetical protein [Nocardioides sp.]